MIKSEHVNAFVLSTLDVLKKMGKVEAVLDLTRQKEIETSHPLSIVIGFTGDLKGTFILRFQEEVACAIGGGMMGTGGPVVFNAICQEAVAELTNVIVGNATGQLADLGFHVRINPPVIRSGKNEHKIAPFVQPVVVIPLRTESGFIELNLSFEHAK